MAAGNTGRPRLALALLAATMLTPLDWVQAAPGDPIGGEFQANSYATGEQNFPAVAMDADGDFVVVWHSDGQDGSRFGIYAQRYNTAGDPVGGEFQVNTTTLGDQYWPAVAMDAGGDFVIVWTSKSQDGSQYGVHAQRYDAAGIAQGGEFAVGSLAPIVGTPAVAMSDAGALAVAWTGCSEPLVCEIFAQRFDATGNPQGGEYLVNTTTTNFQGEPAMAMDADGDFVVTWTSYVASYPTGYDILGQRFNAEGVAQGSEFQINEVTGGWQVRQAVAMDADGDFVVAWEDNGQDGSYAGIFARQFDAGGVARGGEFQVNTTTMDQQSDPAVAMDADGDFVVTWQSLDSIDYADGPYVRGQRYDRTGVPQGGEFDVTTRGSWSAAAMESGGDFVVAWAGGEGPSFGIFGQRFEGGGSGPAVASDFNADGMSDILWRNLVTGNAVIWQMDGFATSATASTGAPDTAWQVEDIGDFDGDRRSDILWRNSGTGATVVWLMDGFTKLASGPVGNVGSAWIVVGLGDFDGDGWSDILWRNTATGSNIVWLMNGFTKKATGSIGGVPLAWEVAGLGDFDGDGRTDILWRNTSSGGNIVWQMNGFAKTATGSIGGVPLAWDVAGLGDFNGGGQADILWRNASTSAAVIWQMNGFTKEAGASIGSTSSDWAVARLGDYNGGGQADVLWRNTSTGGTVVWQMNGLAQEAVQSIGNVSGTWDVQ